jgi:hypothetical protein
VRPKCSSEVVTISSSGPSPSPVTTIWQPRVVESVSATSSGVVPSTPATPPRMRSRSSRMSSMYRLPLRPSATSRSSRARAASTAARGNGPFVPALRYA